MKKEIMLNVKLKDCEVEIYVKLAHTMKLIYVNMLFGMCSAVANEDDRTKISSDPTTETSYSEADKIVDGMDFGELCNEFECLSSPLVESTARQLARDILEQRSGNRALGTFAVSVVYKVLVLSNLYTYLFIKKITCFPITQFVSLIGILYYGYDTVPVYRILSGVLLVARSIRGHHGEPVH